MNSTPTHRLPRWARVLLWSLLALVALVTVALVTATRLVDVPTVRAALEQQVSRLARGQVAWDELHVRMLPRPHAVLRSARIEIPGLLSGGVAAAEVDLALLPLLQGNIEIARVRIEQPVLRLTLAPGTAPPKKRTEPVREPVELYRQAVMPVATVIREFAPALALSVVDADLQISAPALPVPLAFKFSLDATTDRDGLTVTGTASGPLANRVQIDARLAYFDLKADAQLQASGLAPQRLVDALLAGRPIGIEWPEGSMRLTAQTDGQSTASATLTADAPRLSVTRGAAALTMVPVTAQATAAVRGRELELRLTAVRLGDVVPALRGTLGIAADRATTAAVEISELDLVRVRNAVLTLAPPGPALVPYLNGVRSGRAVDGRATARAPTPAALLDPRGITAEAQLDLDVGYELPRGASNAITDLRGRVQARAAGGWQQGQWHADVTLARSDAALRLSALPWPVTLQAAHVRAQPGRVQVDGVRGALGQSVLRRASADLSYGRQLRIAAARAEATLELDDLYPWLKSQQNLAQALRPITAVNGQAQVSVTRVTGNPRSLDSLDFDVAIRPRNVRVTITELPGPVAVNDGSLRLTPSALQIDALSVALLDARARVSGTLADYRSDTRHATVAVTDGALAEQVMAWAWQRAKLPERLMPALPIRISSAQLRASRAGGLDLQAALRPGQGADIEADLALDKGVLDLRRLRIHDADSDATLGAKLQGRKLDAAFSGHFTGRTVASVLRTAPGEHRGLVSGSLRAQVDLDEPRLATAEGKLNARTVDLQILVGLPLRVELADLEADGNRLRVHEATLNWSGQTATVRGEARRSPQGPVVDLQVESPGIDVDALLPPKKPSPMPTDVAKAAPPAPSPGAKTAGPWPLPVTGTVRLKAGHVIASGYRVEPLEAEAVLESNRLQIRATRVALCEVSLPLTAEFTPQGMTGTVDLQAKGLKLETAAQCLTHGEILLTGSFDLQAKLSTRGKPADFLRNLSGTVQARAQNGHVRKFALLGNIMTVRDVIGMLGPNRPTFEGDGFPYRAITAQANLTGGLIRLQQSGFDSSALGLAATGTINLVDGDTRMSVLVAPFSRLDRIVRSVPVIGYIFGGALTSIPVGVSGDIRNPIVVPLGPGAITNELLGIFERTLKLPAELVKPLQPGAPPSGSAAPP